MLSSYESPIHKGLTLVSISNGAAVSNEVKAMGAIKIIGKLIGNVQKCLHLTIFTLNG